VANGPRGLLRTGGFQEKKTEKGKQSRLGKNAQKSVCRKGFVVVASGFS